MQKQRVLSFLLAGVLAFSLLGVSGAAADDDADEYKEELDALSSRYDELEAQQKAITEQINKAKSEKDKYLLQKKELDNQIYSVRQQIGVLSVEKELGIATCPRVRNSEKSSAPSTSPKTLAFPALYMTRSRFLSSL